MIIPEKKKQMKNHSKPILNPLNLHSFTRGYQAEMLPSRHITDSAPRTSFPKKLDEIGIAGARNPEIALVVLCDKTNCY